MLGPEFATTPLVPAPVPVVAGIQSFDIAVPVPIPPLVPTSASTCVDNVSPVAASATVKLLRRSNRAPVDTAADALELELTAELEDLP